MSGDSGGNGEAGGEHLRRGQQEYAMDLWICQSNGHEPVVAQKGGDTIELLFLNKNLLKMKRKSLNCETFVSPPSFSIL